MADPGLSEILTAVFDDVEKTLADNITKNHKILSRLREGQKTWSGGTEIRENLIYGEGNYTRYRGLGKINIAPYKTITAAKFVPKQVAVSMTMSGLEELTVAGDEEIIDFAEARTKSMKATFANNMDADLWSAGLLDEQLIGLQGLIDTTPETGVVGGIDGALWEFWRNDVFDCSSDGNAALSTTNVREYFTTIFVRNQRGTDNYTDILCGDSVFTTYFNSLLPYERIHDQSKKRNSGGPSLDLDYLGVPVVLCGGRGGNCPTDEAFFINTNYLHYRPHSRRNYTKLGQDRYAPDQDGMVRLVGWAGAITVSNREAHARLKP